MVRILIAGDYCPYGRIEDIVNHGNYHLVFGQVKSEIENCDYSIVNLECPVCTTTGTSIKKNGPLLKCSPKSVDALKYAGFRCVTLANNHFYDQGEEGVNETIKVLNKANVSHVGGDVNLELAGRTLYQTVKDKTVAIINCCEHEFSIATDRTGGSNPLSPIRQYHAIKDAKKNADYVVVIVHGGIEHYQYPSRRMVDTYHFFVDAGADAVINHHQHCFSGGEVWHGKPIFYGLGNFCFDWPGKNNKLWTEGYMVKLIFKGDMVDYQLLPYTQNDQCPGVCLKRDSDYNDWKNRFDAISSVIVDKESLDKEYQELLAKTERWYASVLTPYSNRCTIALYMRHMLPMFLTKRKLITLLNLILCESHFDRMVQMLRNYSK